MIKVLIFKQQNCAPCKALTESLKDHDFNGMGKTIWFKHIDMSDPSMEDIELSKQYNVRSAPTTVILKEDGSLYYSGTMVKTAERMEELLKEAVK